MTYVPLNVSQPLFLTNPELPKSMSRHRPPGPRITFSSLMSRWTGIRKFVSQEIGCWGNKKRRTDSLGMKEVESIGYLTKVGPNHVWRETIRETFHELEEIGWGSWFYVDWGDTWHDEVVVVDIFEKVE